MKNTDDSRLLSAGLAQNQAFRPPRTERILVCDRRSEFRLELTRSLLAAIPDVQRIDWLADHHKLVGQYGAARIDLVVLGLDEAPLGGIDTVRELLSAHTSAIVLVVTRQLCIDQAIAAMAAGAVGFLHWTPKPGSGQPRSDPHAYPAQFGAASAAVLDPELTEREIRVLQAMSEGKSNRAIGRELFLSTETVKTHTRRIYRKMVVSDRAEAVAQGFRLGLIR